MPTGPFPFLVLHISYSLYCTVPLSDGLERKNGLSIIYFKMFVSDTGAPRLAKPLRPGPCLDFRFQYALTRKKPVKKFWGRISGLVWLKFAVEPLWYVLGIMNFTPQIFQALFSDQILLGHKVKPPLITQKSLDIIFWSSGFRYSLNTRVNI